MSSAIYRSGLRRFVLIAIFWLGALLFLLVNPRIAAGESGVRLTRALVMVVGVDPQAGVVAVMEKLALQNDGSTPYQPPRWQDSALRLAIPARASGVALESGPPGAELLPLGSGVYTLAAPLPPGESGLVISYALPYQEGARSLRVERGASMPAESLQVLALVSQGIELRPIGRSLGAASETSIGDKRYALLDGKNLAAGADTSFEVRGLPARTAAGAAGAVGAAALRAIPGGQLAEPPLVATAALLLGAALVYGAAQR